MYICHHGVKGQKHGVRQWQNLDGSLTPAGRIHYGIGDKKKLSSEEIHSVEDILSSMSMKDRRLINVPRKDIHEYASGGKEYYDVVARFIEREGDTPVAFLDFQNYDGRLSVTIGTRGGKSYRNKGYASRVSKKGMDWVENNKQELSKKYSEILWLPKSYNKGSRKLAEKNGFALEKSSLKDRLRRNVVYKRQVK